MCLTAIPSRKAAQTLASATSKQELNREAWAAMLRVRTRTECPEGNLRQLRWHSNPNCEIARERERKRERERERENFPGRSPNLRHCRAAHRTKDWANTRGELAGSRPAHPLQEAGRQATARPGKGQTQPQRRHPPPNCEQAPRWQPSLPRILDAWHPPGGLQPESSSPEETHCTPEGAPRKPSGWEGRGEMHHT